MNTTQHTPPATAEIKKSDKFNHVWWLPLIALLMVLFLVVNHYTTKGPLVTLKLQSADGLEVGKTRVKYKDVNIGKVESIQFDENYKSVNAAIRMDKESEGLLKKNTQFWVVKPRIGITQVSGLNTLLSGNHIAIDPDKNPDSPYRYEFTALDVPPLVTQDKPGLKLTLLTAKANSLYPGTAVYYKGMQVGTVDRVYFSADYLWVKADLFIAAPYSALIKQNTRFWSASGVSIGAGVDGLAIDMESVETLIAGGIAFETPISLQKDYPVTSGTEFILYDNKSLAFEQNYGKKHHYVTYFENSVKGLEPGAPVMIQGINVGKVKDIQLIFDEQTGKAHIPVLFEIYESRLGLSDNRSIVNAGLITERLIQKGLRTQLETGNLLTGSQFISLTLLDEASQKSEKLSIDELTGFPVLPSAPPNFDAITSGISHLIGKVNKLPLEAITENLNHLLKSTHTQVDSLEIAQTVHALNQLLKKGQGLSNQADQSLKNLNFALTKLVSLTEKTLEGYTADAPLYYNLNQTLNQLNDTLTSIKAVTDMIDRKPNALIFGEER